MFAYAAVHSIEVPIRRREHLMQSNKRVRISAPGRRWAIALLAALLALPGAGVAVSPVLQGSEPKQPRAASSATTPNFVVVPISTELQRKLLGGDKTLKAYVVLNGASFLQSDNLAGSIDAPALTRALAALKGSDQQSQVVFNTCFRDSASSRTIVDPLEKALGGIAREAGFQKSRHNTTYDGRNDWDARIAAISSADLATDIADEAGVGDPLVMAYPVRTKASQFITNVDCVVFFRKPLSPTDQPLITEPTKDRLKVLVSNLDLQAKNKILFNVSLISQGGLDFETRRALQERLVDGMKTGELQEFGKSLEFTDTAVRFG